jgi:hypothetical protein
MEHVMGMFVSKAAKGDDPRDFVFGEEKYQIAMDDKGNLVGVSFFAGPNPTFIAGSRIEGPNAFASKEFLKAVTEAGTATVAAYKAGKFETYKTAKMKAPRWRIKGTGNASDTIAPTV